MKLSTPLLVTTTFVLSILLIVWAKANQTNLTAPVNDANVISTKGIHIHPEIAIYIKGEKVEIPQDVGSNGQGHSPMHTHGDTPLIHLEYPSLVTKDDTRLKRFFEVWGKGFHDFGQTVAMTVNGAPNTELENYEMKDGDKIELRYE